MKAEVKQRFNGVINGVETDSKEVFYSVQFILEKLEDEKGCSINNREFTKKLVNIFDDIYWNSDYGTLADLEEDTARTIDETPTLSNFSVCVDNSAIDEEFNNELSNGNWDYVLEGVK